MSKKSPGAGATRDDIEISQQNAEADIPSRGHEILGLICGLIGLVTLLAMVSYDGLDTTRAPVRDENIIGPAGMWTAFVLFSSVGAAAWMLNLAFFVHAGALFSGRARKVTVRSAAGIAVIVLLGAVALHTLLRGELLASGHPAGGFIGSVLGELSISVVSTTGTCIIAFGGILLTLLVVTDVSLFLVGRSIGSLLAMAFRHIFHFAARVIRAFVTELPADDPEPVDAPAVEPVIRKKPRRAADVKKTTQHPFPGNPSRRSSPARRRNRRSPWWPPCRRRKTHRANSSCRPFRCWWIRDLPVLAWMRSCCAEAPSAWWKYSPSSR